MPEGGRSWRDARWRPAIPWPLRWIVDADGRDTGFAMLRGGIYDNDRPGFEKVVTDHRMIGFTHYGPFPLWHDAYPWQMQGRPPQEAWERPEIKACEAWAHCFRNPDHYLPPGTPRMLISGSDFVIPAKVTNAAWAGGRPAKRWDLVYSCPPSWLNDLQKNWDLAQSCIAALAEAGARIVIAGRSGVPGLPRHPNIDYLSQLPWTDFMRLTASSRAAFLPNHMDASPKVLPQALALDVPVLVNRQILGGWKYVAPETGVFFDDETDVVDAFFELLDAPVHPHDWLLANGYGQDGAARRLAAELRALGGADELSYAMPTSAPPRR
jgi:glycosyltransferase involved in cell wall biosynthesis